MTDGVLLAEIGHDRDLRRYDTIIIDEAHERSLNIDFLLGYLKQLLASPARPQDHHHLGDHRHRPVRGALRRTRRHPAPIIEVSGRTYPVEVRYRPTRCADGEADQIERHRRRDQGAERGRRRRHPGLPVRRAGDPRRRRGHQRLELRFTEVLPLYARLSAAEQHRVFAGHTGRRVVLATNVAETSLTVPGIRYVIDAGTARISRYSARTKVQRLPIEPISQASANQRAGRCGRVAPGRLHPAVQRGGLPRPAGVHRAGDPADQPRLGDPADGRRRPRRHRVVPVRRGAGPVPDQRRPAAAGGARRPAELAGPNGSDRADRAGLTEIGRRLAAIPVDPRMGRMLLAAERQGCLREMLVIVSGLSIQDPRERPAEQRDKADALHRRFWAPPTAAEDAANHGPAQAASRTAATSWRCCGCGTTSASPARRLSGNAFRRMCRDEFLHFLRIREWQDLHAQLKQICRELGLNRNDAPAAADRIHTAALAGLLSHVGLADVREEREPAAAAAAAAPATAGVPGRPRHPVRHQPRLEPGQGPAAAGGGGRDRRDHPAVGADGRRDHGRAGRGGRRAPAEAAPTPSRTGRPGPAP